MLPWNYGFHWNAGHIIFLGAFYGVLTVVAATLIAAWRRAGRTLREHRVAEVGWHADFHELAPRDRVCRHVLSGSLQSRECPNGFDCRYCETHARLIALKPGGLTEAGELDLFGMDFPLDRYYHRGHAWVHPEPDGTVTVGLDELGQRLLGTPDAVELPPPGAHVEVNGPAFRVKKREAQVRVLSPVDGEVLAAGGAGLGWYLKIKPAYPGELAFRHLLRGPEVKPWLLREMERLQLALVAQDAAPSLPDGGVLVADIGAGYPQADWDAVCGQMFLEP